MQRNQGRVVVQVSVTSDSAGIMVPDSGEMDRMERDALAAPTKNTISKSFSGIMAATEVHGARAAINMFQATPADIVETITAQIKSRLDAQRQLEELPDSVRLQLQAIQDAEDLEKVRGNIRRKARNVFMKAFVESGLEAIALAEDSQEFFDALGTTLSKEMIRHFNTYTQDN